MNVSCGVIVTDGKKVLLCHPTGASWVNEWNLPKGLMDPGETPEVTAIREMKEETGIIAADLGSLYHLGHFAYRPDKALEIFALHTGQLPPLKSLGCVSTFEKHGKHYPEMDGYQYFSWTDAQAKVNPALRKLWPEFRDQYMAKFQCAPRYPWHQTEMDFRE